MRVTIQIDDGEERGPTPSATQVDVTGAPAPVTTEPPADVLARAQAVGAFSGGPAPTKEALESVLDPMPYEPGSGAAPLPSGLGGAPGDISAGSAPDGGPANEAHTVEET